MAIENSNNQYLTSLSFYFSHPESIDIISTEQVYAALLTPEDHYCELTPHIVKTKSGVDDKESRLDKTSSTVIRYSGKSQSTTNCNTMTR